MIFLGQTFNIEWGYTPETKVAIDWHHRSDGTYSSSDRGISEDKYYASFSYRDEIANVYALESALASNKDQTTSSITLSEGEEIFGAEVVTGAHTAMVISKTPVQRISFTHAEMTLRVLLTSTPTKVSLTGDLDHLVYGYEYQADRLYDMYNHITLDNTVAKSHRGYDQYVFNHSFILTHEEMQYTREFLLTDNRASSFTLPSLTTVEPFGPSVSAPHTVKIVDWKDEGRLNQVYWGINITMVRH